MSLKISVVVPSFNQAEFIGQTLSSIISQGPALDIQCIVMDGGSTDDSVDVIRSLELAARSAAVDFHWVSARDGGQAAAINDALARADGDILAYLNSDDCYAAGALNEVVAAFEAAPERDWLTGNCLIVNASGREIQKGVRLYREAWMRRYSRTGLMMLNFIAQPATFWRRSAAQRIGPFDAALRYTMDYDYWLRLSELGAPLHLDHVLAHFRIHGQSKGGSRFVEQFREDYATVCRYTRSRSVRLFHRLHNGAIVLAYRLIK